MGDIHIITNFQTQKTKPPPEEDEETLSLCDFPTTNCDKNSASNKFQDTKRRSSSEPSDFFEFFNAAVEGSADTMSHAEDIIFCGKLVPYYHHHHHHHHKNNQPQILKSLSADDASRKYSQSPPPPPDYYLNPTRPVNRRRCRRRRHPFVNPDGADIHRSLSKSSAKSDGSAKISKPSKWPFVLMFGPLKLQPEMDLQDMKNRQTRRNVAGSVFFPAAGSKSNTPARRRSSWGYDLLKVLSCKSHASVAVTASIGLVPHF